MMAAKMKHTKCERLNIRFNREIKLEFHGARLTSDGSSLAAQELDDALGLFWLSFYSYERWRTGQHILTVFFFCVEGNHFIGITVYNNIGITEKEE